MYYVNSVLQISNTFFYFTVLISSVKSLFCINTDDVTFFSTYSVDQDKIILMLHNSFILDEYLKKKNTRNYCEPFPPSVIIFCFSGTKDANHQPEKKNVVERKQLLMEI